MDKRKHKRYQLNASVKFYWEPVNGGGGSGEGLTRDMSVSSAYIVTSNRIPVATVVRMLVTLPAIQPTARNPQLSLEARIVRADAFGFAVTGDMGFQLECPECQGSATADGSWLKSSAVLFYPGPLTRAS